MTDFTASLARRSSTRKSYSLFEYLDLYRQRRALASLSAEQLDDIGVSAADASQEAQRPVWDVPNHWRR